jgi:glycosyltransferase involved in cell wall biosynthesis
MKKKVVVYVPGGGFDVYFSSLPVLLRQIVRWALSGADPLVLQTRLSAEKLGGSFSNLQVISNWMRTAEAKPANGEDGAIRFVFMGEVRRDKGIGELLAAFPRARQQMREAGIEITLDVYGAARPEAAEAVEMMARGWYPGIRYHPPVSHDRYLRELAKYDVVVLPTYMPSEGHPGVLIEAMSLGIPTIATRWRSLPEIVKDGVNGLLCEPRDTESLRISIETMASDADLRQRLGASGRETAPVFAIDNVLPQLTTLCGLAALTSE